MRRFFRFSIRDLLWLTLVVAVGLAWWLRDRELQADVERASDRATKWRRVAGGFEHYFAEGGWFVKWKWESAEVHLDSGAELFGTHLVVSTNSHEPSSPD